MPQVKVIVDKLNKRSAPVADLSDKRNVIGEVFKGFSFEAEKMQNEIGDWYRDRDNSFYWGGGLTAGTASTAATDHGWAHTMFGITECWQNTGCRGEGTRVAILDSGINEQLPVFKTIVAKKNFDPLSETTLDDTGHGTGMACMVAGSGDPVYGVAPAAGLLIAKVNTDIDDSLVQAVNWAAEQHADIISMSFECALYVDAVFNALQRCQSQGIALIAAAGNGGSGGQVKNKYPASYPCCYSIGACGKNMRRFNSSNLSDFLCMLSPGEDVLTVNKDGLKDAARGTSIATAYTSGVVALLLSIARRTLPSTTAVSVMETLKANTKHEPYMTNPLEYGKGIIHPVPV